MQLSITSMFLAVVCGQTPQAHYRTTNFVIHADCPKVARMVGEAAENSRNDLAKYWLDEEAGTWAFPCRINVAINMGKVEGFTDVTFDQGKVRSIKMEIKGPLDRVLKGALPHELTHVLFANHFGFQLPRWADEGGAILSEDEHQGERQAKLLKKILAEERCFTLRRLLEMQEYPTDMPCLYAQGHSVARYLVDSKSRKVFLNFVRDGLERGWDEAAANEYGFKNVEQLEKSWLAWVEKDSVRDQTTLREKTDSGLSNLGIRVARTFLSGPAQTKMSAPPPIGNKSY